MSNKPALIATIIVALLAVGTLAFAVIKLTSGEEPGDDDEPELTAEYIPSEEVEEEILGEVERLAADNLKVLELFYTVGLKHKDEPYGNTPEDGYYTAITDDYGSVDEIFALVDNAFEESAAQRIKNDPTGIGAVYAQRRGGEIGINVDFEPIEYDLIWDNPECKIDFLSDTECVINISLKDRDGADVVKSMNMEKSDGGNWLLENIIM